MGERIRVPSIRMLTMALLIAACGGGDEARDAAQGASSPDHKLNVYVVNYPLQYIAERIGGDVVEVTFPAPPDVDPAFWKPKPEVVGDYQEADLILLNGAGYARWIDRVSLPISRLVDTSRAFKDQYVAIKGTLTHQHGPKGEHAHRGTAFTTWLDPTLAIAQAQAIKEVFVERRPDQESLFEEGFGSLQEDLLELDRRMKQAVSKAPERPLLASHPVYQYLAKRYNLNLESVHWEPEEAPNEKMWQALEDVLARHPAKWMIWEGPPREETKTGLASRGVEIAIFPPCGNVPEAGDYLSVMRRNVGNLESAFGD